MALPLIPLAARAALSLARNKKMRDALTKSVGGFLKRRQKLATTAKTLKNKGLKLQAKFPKPSSGKKLSTGAKVGLGFGAGVASGVTTDRKLQLEALKKEKKKNNKIKPKRSMTWNK